MSKNYCYLIKAVSKDAKPKTNIMGFFSKLFGSKQKKTTPTTQKKTERFTQKREGQPDVVNVRNSDDAMNWGIEKANLTLHFFEDSLRNPQKGQMYFSIKVKIIDGGQIEHIWLDKPSFDDEGNLYGNVGNAPINVTSVQQNQKIGIDRNLISDWMIIENGRLIGGYTIRAAREGLTGQALANFDRGLGGIFVDEGDDYFPADLNTPEGAITLLEESYNKKDIEKAMTCKDFTIEGKMMMQAKTGKAEVPDTLVKSVSEVLKLSYIKSLQDNGIPNFQNVKRAFVAREKITEKNWIITVIYKYPDGHKHLQKMSTYLTDTGWKVLSPVS